jgi:HEAT repeat protein
MGPIFFAWSLLAHLPPYEKIEAYLQVEASGHALKNVESLYEQSSNDPKLFALYLKVLAKVGKEKEMLQVWKKFHQAFPSESMEQEVLEDLGWGILRKGARSSQQSNQLIALIGSTLTQDRYAVPILLSAMRGSSIPMRHVAVQLSTMMRDHELINEIVRLAHEEKNIKVRVQALQAMGELKLKEQLPYLMNLVEHSRVRDEEKLAAIAAIVNIKDDFTAAEMQHLVDHPKSKMRLLAAMALKQQLEPQNVHCLGTLLNDSNQEVVVQAIHCAGILGVKENLSYKMQQLANSSSPSIGIAASWYLLVTSNNQGASAMGKWLNHPHVKRQREAAAATAIAGQEGISLARQFIKEKNDSYVRLNLALGLINQRVLVRHAKDVLVEAMQNHEKWMRDESSLFHPIVPSTLSHCPEIPYFPEVVNQRLRLELTQLLSFLEDPRAGELLRELFQHRQQGVTSLVGEVLLGVGDEVAIEHVYQLLEDDDPKIRLEAALMLGMSAKEKKVLPHLIEAFHKEQKQGKLQIIEAIGRIGGRESIPFLLEQMENPSLNLRLAASAMLILALKG